MEAIITLEISDNCIDIVELLKIFKKIGWGIYNSQGKIEYLPLGDKDDYNWQCEEMTEIKFYDVISGKIICKEIVGVNLFYQYGEEGVTLLAYDTHKIMLNLSINRKCIYEKHTDMIWYFNNIIYKFFQIGVKVLAYKLEEFED